MNLKMQEWKSWCRLCALTNASATDIFIKDLESNSNIAEDLQKICNLKLENTIDLPSKICKNCEVNVKNFKEFLTNSIKVQQMFAEYMQGNTNDWECLRKKYKLTYITDIKKEQDIFTTLKFSCNNESEIVKYDTENKNLIGVLHDDILKPNDSLNEPKEEDLNDNEFHKFNEIESEIEEEHINSRLIDELKDEPDTTESKKIDKQLIKLKKTSKNNVTVKTKKEKDGKKVYSKFQCKLCEKSFLNQGGLTVHMKIKHSILKDPYKCKFCNKIFERKSRLEIHENAHLPSEERKQLSCPHCEKKFNSESGRWSHIHSVHDKKKTVICEECGKEFSTKHHLVKHKISHSQEKNLQCPHCPAKFKAKVGLTAHIEIHGESFPCAICGVLLNTKQLLKKHMIVHSDVKNFKCNFCNKDFKRSKELNSHLITHIGIKPFECRICNEKFVHDMTYRRHLKATHPTQFADMVAKGERISSRNFPPPEQLKAINEAAKNIQ